MTGYLLLELDDLVIDPALAARLPAGLAAYYLALPLGFEDGAVSVAMAHPENHTALAVLESLLAGPIVPVRAPAAAIRRALSRYYRAQPVLPPRVLAWSADEEHADLVRTAATLFATALSATLTTVSAPGLDLDSALTVARAGSYNLTVLYPSEDLLPAQLLQQAITSVFLVLRPIQELRRILIILRGYSADEYALEWLAPLLQPDTSVTLMPLLEGEGMKRPRPFLPTGPQKAHLQECLRHPALRRAQAFVKLRQGQVVEQVAEEIEQGDYDLVVISAEGYGHFVSRILTALEEQEIDRQHSLFILIPPGNGGRGESERGEVTQAYLAREIG